MSNVTSSDTAGPSNPKRGPNGDQHFKTLHAENGVEKKQKRKRESEAGLVGTHPQESTSVSASSLKGKGRAVAFAEEATTQHEGSPQVPRPPAEALSQKDAFKASKVKPDTPENSKTTKKTKAKARYLKAKMARYKARKRSDRQSKSEAGSSVGDLDTDMNDTMITEDGDNVAADTSATVDAAEEKRARKKAKREERRAKEVLEANTSTANLSTNAVPDQSPEEAAISGPSKLNMLEDAEKRKAERKAKKAAKRLAAENADLIGDSSIATGIQEGDEQVLLKRDLAVLAKAEELKARQDKANKRAKAKQKYSKSEGDEEDKENEDLQEAPTQPDVLPRFPKPIQPVAPSQRELDDLLISHDLRHAVLVDQGTSVSVTELQGLKLQIKLSQQTLDRLQDMKIEKFFAVQSAVLPVLLENRKLYTTRQRPRDICVSAPTGSGKTLSYVIPVVETLASRVVTRLRALVVLPTRELVMQVRDVFEQFCKGTGLRVAAATGQHSFAGEQNAIVEDHEHELKGGSSKVDILVVTPGRLMDHLRSTKNFTLQHLRFLVIDEADRLLSQNFNDWLKVLIAHIENKEGMPDAQDDSAEQAPEDREADSDVALETDALAPQLVKRCLPLLDATTTSLPSSAQKLLFSATLTRDPARIAALNLYKPVYIAVVSKSAEGDNNPEQTASTLLESDRNFALPETLTEKMIVTRTSDKALTFLYLLYTLKLHNTLCFTKSVESAARLVMLVDAFNVEYAKEAMAGTFEPLKIAHYSSELGPGLRKEVMDSFRKGDIHVLVCSDIAARGLDIPTLENVVNYDVPVAMRNYVHRVGRTARAGRSGTAWSLVEVQEAKYFKTLLSEAGRLSKVKNTKVKRDDLAMYKDAFESALNNLQV